MGARPTAGREAGGSCSRLVLPQVGRAPSGDRAMAAACYAARVNARALLLSSLLASLLVGTSACRPKATAAPYETGHGPDAAMLIAGAKPQLAAIAVPEAKVVANRVLRGNLSFLAQAPGRFRGSVQVSGNELVTLAFTEDGYALRYKLDAFPTGFYHGPPSACAVEALLGVALDTEDLVALVLGGAPIIAEPYEVAEQKWDANASREAITIHNGTHVQRLEFAWAGDTWRFAGSKLWRRNPDGSKGAWIWSFAHEEMRERGGAVLPARTRVEAPGKRKDNLIVIQYRDRDLDPAFAKPVSTGDDGPSTDDGTPEEGGDDWGGEDDGWESKDDDGWEGKEDAPTGPPPKEAPAKPTGTTPPTVTLGLVIEAAPTPGDPAPTPGEATPAGPSKAPAGKSAAPAVFTIKDTGLRDRGDLCR